LTFLIYSGFFTRTSFGLFFPVFFHYELSRTDWNDFTDAIEDVHDAVHSWVSGDMGVVGTALDHTNFNGTDMTSARIDAAQEKAFTGGKNQEPAFVE